ncbi:C-type lectin domain family 4 member K-like [Tachyglossus aculeatus]|uniref:C-type lectin domain family 4 member K-like n=1 Tax=Tachyglossus aculeatus TaxID=9261 RepID=UPI0018F4021C|nr:C-type lectin domain family 4 member K-like [Tachyglossus aculeatus]
MDPEDYENVSLGKISPWPLGQFLRVETRQTPKTPYIVRAALILLTTALVASLVAVTILYFQGERHHRRGEEAGRQSCLANISALNLEIQEFRGRLENMTALASEVKTLRNQLRRATATTRGPESLEVYLEGTPVVRKDPVRVGDRLEDALTFSEASELQGGPSGDAFSRAPDTVPPHAENTTAFAGFADVSKSYLEAIPAPRKDTKKPQGHLQNVTSGEDPVTLKRDLENISVSYKAMRAEYNAILNMFLGGWRLYGGNLYYFSQDKKSWDEAERFCKSWNSHLTSVTSKKEQDYLSKKSKGTPHWIGLRDRGTGRRRSWSDGTPFQEAESKWFWEEGRPDNRRQEEECVEMRTKERSSWNGGDCQNRLHWICKKVPRQFGSST